MINRLVASDENSSIVDSADHLPHVDDHQVYVNTYPQYDPHVSYHGYDLSRDVSEYRFGDDPDDPKNNAVRRSRDARREIDGGLCQSLGSTFANAEKSSSNSRPGSDGEQVGA